MDNRQIDVVNTTNSTFVQGHIIIVGDKRFWLITSKRMLPADYRKAFLAALKAVRVEIDDN